MDKLELSKRETLILNISCNILELFASLDDESVAMSVLHNVIGNQLKSMVTCPDELDLIFAAFVKELNGRTKAAIKLTHDPSDDRSNSVNRNPTKFIRFGEKGEA